MTMRFQWLGTLCISGAVLVALPVQAAVVYNCPGSICELSELLEGGTITIDDKLFSNFRSFSSTVSGPGPINVGMPITADNIRVFSQADELGPLGVTGEVGLAFNIGFGNPTQLALLDTGQSLSIHWEYDITVLDPNMAIVDNTLLFPVGIHNGASIQNTADTDEGASLQVQEQLLLSTGEELVRKSISATGSAGTPISDHRDFAPATSLHVITDISGFGGNHDQPQTSVVLDWVVQSFSQQTVPEPAPLALLGLGFACLALVRRRRH